MSRNTIIAIVVAVLVILIFGMNAGWFGGSAPTETTAPATTEQPAATTEQPATQPSTGTGTTTGSGGTQQ